MLPSFARFERAVTAERIRDEIAALKKKGMWMGGGVPLDHKVMDRRLIVDEAAAARVRYPFRLYLELVPCRGCRLSSTKPSAGTI